jgi:RNA-binding protein YlmH
MKVLHKNLVIIASSYDRHSILLYSPFNVHGMYGKINNTLILTVYHKLQKETTYMEMKLFLNLIEDRYRKFQKTYSLVNTDFLDLAQSSAASTFVKAHQRDGVFFYGGYENAERRQIVFVPDYFGVESEEDLFEYFRENPEECPLVLIDVKILQKGAELKHSDYLGSLLALGIKREKTGDIMVREDGAQIFISKEIAEYVAENYFKAGRVPLDVKILQINHAVISEPQLKHIRVTIASPRLDNIISAVFDIPRKSAVEAIGRGIVFVDSVQAKKADYMLKGGEKLVLRGKGKAVYKGIGGTSRKGKLYAEFEKYI